MPKYQLIRPMMMTVPIPSPPAPPGMPRAMRFVRESSSTLLLGRKIIGGASVILLLQIRRGSGHSGPQNSSRTARLTKCFPAFIA